MIDTISEEKQIYGREEKGMIFYYNRLIIRKRN